MTRIAISIVLLLLVSSVVGCGESCPTPREFCDGNTLHSCFEEGDVGTVTRWDEIDCAVKSQVCVTTTSGSFCASSATLDPRCEAEVNGYIWRCDGATALACRAGYLLGGTTCANRCVYTNPRGEEQLECNEYVAPGIPSCCRDCDEPDEKCQPNGCYGDFWCSTESCVCWLAPYYCEAPEGEEGKSILCE